MRIFILLLALFTLTACVEDINFYSYILEMFNKHNKYRELHGLNKAIYSDELAEHAYLQAKGLADEMRWFYSNSTWDDMPLGENFFFCSSFDNISCLPQNDVTFFWYKEYYDYCMSSHSFPYSAKNFVTMMWKETIYMGCGIEYRRYWDCMDSYFVVCQYSPGINPYLGASSEEIARNMQDRTKEDDDEKNPNPC